MPSKQSDKHILEHRQLDNLCSAELRHLFLEHFGHDPGGRASRMHMEGNLSWAEQTRQQGEQPQKLRKKLQADLDKVVSRHKTSISAYQAGTRLVREWHGTVYEVIVVEDGYAWNGRTYRSLSQIATAITGVRWSGPRFFGLKGANR